MDKILYISKGIIHPSKIQQNLVYEILTSFKYEIISLKNFPKNCEEYSWIVAFFHEKTILNSELMTIEKYLNNGGQLLLLHGALASYKNSKKYTNLIGSKFINHSKVSKIKIFRNSQFIDSVTDELYNFSFKTQPTVLYSGKTSNQNIPICWVINKNKGKIVGFSLGHKKKTIKSNLYSNILKKILENNYEN